jgi:hypothetical protein
LTYHAKVRSSIGKAFFCAFNEFVFYSQQASFSVHALKWNVDGGSLALVGKDQFCLTYLTGQNDVKTLNEQENEIE